MAQSFPLPGNNEELQPAWEGATLITKIAAMPVTDY